MDIKATLTCFRAVLKKNKSKSYKIIAKLLEKKDLSLIQDGWTYTRQIQETLLKLRFDILLSDEQSRSYMRNVLFALWLENEISEDEKSRLNYDDFVRKALEIETTDSAKKNFDILSLFGEMLQETNQIIRTSANSVANPFVLLLDKLPSIFDNFEKNLSEEDIKKLEAHPGEAIVDMMSMVGLNLNDDMKGVFSQIGSSLSGKMSPDFDFVDALSDIKENPTATIRKFFGDDVEIQDAFKQLLQPGSVNVDMKRITELVETSLPEEDVE